MRKTVLLLLIALFAVAVAANPEDIEITRLLDGMPDNQTYAEYLAQRTPPTEANFTTVYHSLTTGAGDDIRVLVNSSLHSGITTNLNTWVSDLETEGYTVTVSTSGVVTAEVLRAQFQTWWNGGMDGIVLIGEFDSGWFQGDFFGGDIGYEEFPCDLYLTDLDGDWQDLEDEFGDPNPDDIYDYHEDGSGNMEPDIYLGRVTAYNLNLLSSTEAEIVNAWLTRVHTWHNGGSGMPRTSLTYIDHDWAGSGWGNDVDLLYSTENESFYWPDVDRDDYFSRLDNDPREHQLLCCHSWPLGHAFHTGGNAIAAAVLARNPQICFYNLFCCSNARYTVQSLGALYALGTDQGLLSVGSTKTGSMLKFDHFYGNLASGMSWGDAFKVWHAYVAEGYSGMSQQGARGWFYGMTLIGDPTLMPTNNSAVEVVTFTAEGVEEGALLSWSVDADGALLGFNLYRGDGERLSEGRTKLNDSLISGDGVLRYLDNTDATGLVSYYLEAVEVGGETTVFGPAVCNLYDPEILTTRLVGVYPNPVSSTAAVELELAEAGVAELALYDLAGRRVDTLHIGELTAGRHSFSVDSSTLTDGIYLLHLTSGATVSTQRLVIVR